MNEMLPHLEGTCIHLSINTLSPSSINSSFFLREHHLPSAALCSSASCCTADWMHVTMLSQSEASLRFLRKQSLLSCSFQRPEGVRAACRHSSTLSHWKDRVTHKKTRMRDENRMPSSTSSGLRITELQELMKFSLNLIQSGCSLHSHWLTHHLLPHLVPVTSQSRPAGIVVTILQMRKSSLDKVSLLAEATQLVMWNWN
jgi:hypothetical protein